MRITLTLDIVDDPAKLDSTITTLKKLDRNPYLWEDEPAVIRDCAVLWGLIKAQADAQRQQPMETPGE